MKVSVAGTEQGWRERIYGETQGKHSTAERGKERADRKGERRRRAAKEREEKQRWGPSSAQIRLTLKTNQTNFRKLAFTHHGRFHLPNHTNPGGGRGAEDG